MTIQVQSCRFCKHRVVAEPDGFQLFKYGVRHWAHATCLASRYGSIVALERIPIGERAAFKRTLRATWSGWIRALISVKDDAERRRRAKATVTK